MDYDKAVRSYVELRDEIKAIERDADTRMRALKIKQDKLALWLELQSGKDGLEKIATRFGTVFWTVVDSCSVSNRTAFMDFVRENEAWELMETRAAKLAIRDYIQTHNVLPPGVEYATRKSINVRSK